MRERLLLAIVLGISLIFVPCLSQQTLTVPDDSPTIQAAIDAAQPGDTVYIRVGRYVENLTITKPLHLVGEDRTKVVIQSPDAKKDVITVQLSQGDVHIEGILIRGGDKGIYYDGDGDFVVQECIVAENRFGVIALGASCLIEKCCIWGSALVGVVARRDIAPGLEQRVGAVVEVGSPEELGLDRVHVVVELIQQVGRLLAANMVDEFRQRLLKLFRRRRVCLHRNDHAAVFVKDAEASRLTLRHHFDDGAKITKLSFVSIVNINNGFSRFGVAEVCAEHLRRHP